MNRSLFFCCAIIAFSFQKMVAGVMGAHDCCACQPTVQSSAICYVGSLELDLKGTQGRDFTVLYKGVALKVHDGVYCFKESENILPLHMLFVDANDITYDSEDNTVNSLILTKNARYYCCTLTRVESPASGADVSVDWVINPVNLSHVDIRGILHLQVPLSTIVIPLGAHFFERSAHGDIVFDGQEAKESDQIVRLPRPRLLAKNQDALLKAVVEADIALLNLKNIHVCQEQTQVCMDKHSLVQ